MILDLQYVVIEAFASTVLTFELDVGHELHTYHHETVTLTLFAPAAGPVERK